MQKFDFKKFNVHGTKFHMVHARYDSTNGLKLEVTDQTVSVVSGVCATGGGIGFNGFVANGSSCTTSDFYEVNSFSEVNDLFMPVKCNTYVYCLPENLEDVKYLIMNHLRTSLQKYHDEQLKPLAKIRSELHKYFYTTLLND